MNEKHKAGKFKMMGTLIDTPGIRYLYQWCQNEFIFCLKWLDKGKFKQWIFWMGNRPYVKEQILDFIAIVKCVVFRLERHDQTKSEKKDIGH